MITITCYCISDIKKKDRKCPIKRQKILNVPKDVQPETQNVNVSSIFRNQSDLRLEDHKDRFPEDNVLRFNEGPP